MRNLVSTVSIALFLSLSTGALAQTKEDRPQAELALKEGIKAYKDGQYEEALAAYQRAAALAPTASGPYREMGKTYEALGREKEAQSAYQEYLRRKPDADDADEINGRLKVLDAKNPSKTSEVAALTLTDPENPAAPSDKPEGKKRSRWVWVAGGAALVGLGVGTAVAIDAIESGGGDNSGNGGKGNGGGKDDDDKRKRSRTTPLLFTFGF